MVKSILIKHFFVCEWHSSCKQNATSLQHCVLLELGSFMNLVICICVLSKQTMKLAHTLEIGCFSTHNNQFCFCLKES